MMRRNDNVCHNFQNGKCNRGSSCKFDHIKREKNNFQINSVFSDARGIETSRLHYFNDIINNRKKITSQNDGRNFFKSILDHKDTIELLYELSNELKSGKDALRLSFLKTIGQTNEDIEIFNNSALLFLELLGKDELNNGAAKLCTFECYLIAFETPGFLNCIEYGLSEKQIKRTDIIAWWLVTVIKSKKEARDNPIVHRIANILSNDKNYAVRSLLTILIPNQLLKENEINITKVESLQHLQALAPQHDNDFPFSYRDIKILPTIEEINSPMISSTGLNYDSKSSTTEKTAFILDRQFRLLREDMIATMKEELPIELRLDKMNRKRIFNAPQLLDVSIEPNQIPCMLIKVQVPKPLHCRVSKMNQKERIIFFEEVGRKVLGKESMLAFLDNNNKAIFVGLIVRRNKEEFAAENGYFCFGVHFQNVYLEKILYNLQDRSLWNKDNDNNNNNKLKFKTIKIFLVLYSNLLHLIFHMSQF